MELFNFLLLLVVVLLYLNLVWPINVLAIFVNFAHRGQNGNCKIQLLLLLVVTAIGVCCHS